MTSCFKNDSIKYVPVADFYNGKSVFITGGTGYLGKVFIEKLLCNCSGIENIYVLIRKKKSHDHKVRIQQILDNPLFQRVKENTPEDFKKIIPIEGDMTAPNLGISTQNENTLIDKVSVVFHTAATVKFNEELKVAFNINLEGTKKVINLCQRMKNLQAFVHVSTAFSNPNNKFVEEKIYPPPMELSEVYKYIEQENKADVTKIIGHHPNTYTFTKALTETYLLKNHGNLPTTIVRPSIVLPYKEEPLQGWLDNYNGPTSFLIGAAKGLHRIMPGDGNNIAGSIPVDYIVNLSIVSATRCERSQSVKVYNSCTSSTNPITWREMLNFFMEECKSVGIHGFYPKLLFLKSHYLIKILVYILQIIPAYLCDIWRIMTGRKARYIKLQNRLIAATNASQYFTSHSWVFDVSRANELWATLSPDDQKMFPYNPRDVNWKSFMKNYCKGVNKYLLTHTNDSN